MRNAKIIKEINNNKEIKQENLPVGAILIARKLQRNCLEYKQAGITLIALVITIIVLLILSAVTINLTLGERGIFNTAKKAVENYKNVEEKELANLNNFEQEMNNTINGLGNSSSIDTTIKQPVTNIKIEPENIELEIGETKTLKASIEPENATNKNIEFISGNEDIITVGKQTKNEDGTVSIEMTAIAEGTTTVTAKSKYGENGKEVTGDSTVTVLPEKVYLYNHGTYRRNNRF